MSDFFDDYLNEIHDEEIAKNLRGLKKEYHDKKDEIIKNAGPKIDMAASWQKLTNTPIETTTTKDSEDLDNTYKQKAMDMARPGIEDEAKFNELAKKHAPQIQQEHNHSSGHSASENVINSKEAARQKFLQQFKTNAHEIEKERD